jgi:8-hydroxy-5-deazaflavin:NADPH oxidoreductase
VTTVTILGAGNMARGIATRLLAAGGNTVRILAPHAEHAPGLAAQLARGDGASVSGGGADEPLDGEVVVLAVWYDAAVEVAERRAGELAGKIVIEISNPVDVSTFDGLVTPPGTSAAEEVAARAPDARVVKAFNTTFAGTLVNGQVAGQQLDVLLASDDDDAKARVAGLVEAAGLRPVDAGPLRRARQLEQTGFLHMALQNALGTGFGSALKIVTP